MSSAVHTATAVSLHNVTKRYGTSVVAVRDVSLTVHPGEFFALLGPSGCGKSTTLRLLAGLESPDAGQIHFGSRTVAGPSAWVPPEKRETGFVFQDYALFPHLTVAQNIGFALDGWSRDDRNRRVGELLEMVHLDGLERRFPHEISGGQQQRVALARALAEQPVLVLLDEPFSNLDAALRGKTREDVKEVLASQGITTVLVTHDREEALSLADRVGVMLDGALVQVGPPEEIYGAPVEVQVAKLGGSAATIAGVADGESVACELGRIPLRTTIQGAVEVLLRPESVTIGSDPDGDARVIKREFLGPFQLVTVSLPSGLAVPVRVAPEESLAVGSRCTVTVPGPVTAFPSE